MTNLPADLNATTLELARAFCASAAPNGKACRRLCVGCREFIENDAKRVIASGGAWQPGYATERP